MEIAYSLRDGLQSNAALGIGIAPASGWALTIGVVDNSFQLLQVLGKGLYFSTKAQIQDVCGVDPSVIELGSERKKVGARADEAEQGAGHNVVQRWGMTHLLLELW